MLMKTLRGLAAILLVFGFQETAMAATIGQIQTFDDPHGWVIGLGPVIGAPTPVPVALGGPSGPADPYLSLVSTGGSGPGSRLSAQNFAEWSGNYLAAGINELQMDVRNFGPDDLSLRLLFLEFGAFGPVNAAFTTAAIFLPGGSDWERVSFSIAPADLTALPGLGTAVGALSNVHELRIFHNPAPFFVPTLNPAVVATLGVDNITAVPEPATLMLLASAAAFGAHRRRARRVRQRSTSNRVPPAGA
jgi:hypothetical protein